jgi:hypothetical protein
LLLCAANPAKGTEEADAVPHVALAITAILAVLNGIVIVAVLVLVTAVRNTPQARCEIAEADITHQTRLSTRTTVFPSPRANRPPSLHG